MPKYQKFREYVVNANLVLRLEATERSLAKARELNPLRRRGFLLLVPICVNYILPKNELTPSLGFSRMYEKRLTTLLCARNTSPEKKSHRSYPFVTIKASFALAEVDGELAVEA